MLTVPMPATAIVAGSGISSAFDSFRVVQEIPYSDIEGFPQSHVKGHSNVLQVIDFDGVNVLVFRGRFHLYEGYSPEEICAQVKLCSLLGIRNLLLTNACGGLHWALNVGDLVLCSETINLTAMTLPQWAMQGRACDNGWMNSIETESRKQGVALRRATYAQVLGPSFETRAEIKMLRKIGADVVGMSTAIEAHAATSVGLKVAIVSVVTNVLSDTECKTLAHEEVLETGMASIKRLEAVFRSAIFAQ